MSSIQIPNLPAATSLSGSEMLEIVQAGVSVRTTIAAITVNEVVSVSNLDGTLTISPTIGNVVASLNLGHPNTWTAVQTFTNNDLKLLGSSTGATTLASANSSTTNYTITFPAATGTVALTSGANVASVSNSDGTLTISPTTGAVVASLNLSHANTWVGAQTFTATVTGNASKSGGVTTSAFYAASAVPALSFNATGDAANAKRWSINATSGVLNFQAINDAENQTLNWLNVTRSGVNVSNILLGILGQNIGFNANYVYVTGLTSTNYFNIDGSTASADTGFNIKPGAAGGGLALSVISSGTNESLKIDAKGSGTITLGGTSTGAIILTRATTAPSINGLAITSSTGVLTIANGKTLTQSNTLTFTGTDGSSVNFGAGGTVLYSGGSYVSSIAGTANQITASASTGAVTLSLPSALIAPGTLQVTGHTIFEGVTSTGATGTGNIMYSASPTTTGTLTAAAANFSGVLTNAINQNAATQITVSNNDATASGAAFAGLFASNGTSQAQFGVLGTAYLASGIYQPQRAFAITNSSNGIMVGTQSNAPVVIVTNSAESARFTTTGLGLFMTPVYAFDVTNSNASIAAGSILNNNSGVSAQAGWRLDNGTSIAGLFHTGASYTTGGVFRQNGTYLYGAGAGGLSLIAGAAQPIYFAVNSLEAGRFGTDGSFLVGATTNTGAGSITATATIRTGLYTVSTLPAGADGQRAFVTDALTPVALAGVVGGGAIHVPVYYSSGTSSWLVG